MFLCTIQVDCGRERVLPYYQALDILEQVEQGSLVAYLVEVKTLRGVLLHRLQMGF